MRRHSFCIAAALTLAAPLALACDVDTWLRREIPPDTLITYEAVCPTDPAMIGGFRPCVNYRMTITDHGAVWVRDLDSPHATHRGRLAPQALTKLLGDFEWAGFRDYAKYNIPCTLPREKHKGTIVTLRSEGPPARFDHLWNCNDLRLELDPKIRNRMYGLEGKLQAIADRTRTDKAGSGTDAIDQQWLSYAAAAGTSQASAGKPCTRLDDIDQPVPPDIEISYIRGCGFGPCNGLSLRLTSDGRLSAEPFTWGKKGEKRTVQLSPQQVRQLVFGLRWAHRTPVPEAKCDGYITDMPSDTLNYRMNGKRTEVVLGGGCITPPGEATALQCDLRSIGGQLEVLASPLPPSPR